PHGHALVEHVAAGEHERGAARPHLLEVAHDAGQAALVGPALGAEGHGVRVVVGEADDAHHYLHGRCCVHAMSLSTSAAMASDDVSPGESMPTSFTRPGHPRPVSSATTKSRKPAPGPCSLARMPLRSGVRSASSMAGTSRRTAGRNVRRSDSSMV